MFNRLISKDKFRDAGMAFVLICLFLAFIVDDLLYVKIAIALLITNMTFPVLFKYPAYLWFGLSQLIGSIV